MMMQVSKRAKFRGKDCNKMPAKHNYYTQLELTFAANAAAKDELRKGKADDPALQQAHDKLTSCEGHGDCATLHYMQPAAGKGAGCTADARQAHAADVCQLGAFEHVACPASSDSNQAELQRCTLAQMRDPEKPSVHPTCAPILLTLVVVPLEAVRRMRPARMMNMSSSIALRLPTASPRKPKKSCPMRMPTSCR